MDNADALDDLDQTGSSNGLFSMSATDNAEVVNPGDQSVGEGLWSVSAKTLATDEPDPGSDDPWEDAVPTAGYPSDGTDSGAPVYEPNPDDGQANYDYVEIEEVEGEIVDGPHDDDDIQGDFAGGVSGDDAFGQPTSDSGAADDSFWDDDFDDDDDDVYEDPDVGYGSTGSRATDSVGSVFSADPVERRDDVVDEPDVIDDDVFTSHEGPSSSLFSSGGTVGGGGPAAFSGIGAPYFTPAGHPGGPDSLWDSTDDAPQRGPRGAGPLRSEPLWESSESAYAAQGVSESYLQDPRPAFGEEDSPGYEAAILKLHPQDRERASVALSVAGALLKEGESVLGVVTGQMLGRPAAVVFTVGRVLVVNDRRWQPVVDIYKIEPDLRVRGRHDRNIAALSFSDEWSLSMVDGITEVSLAMDLAEQIRLIADA